MKNKVIRNEKYVKVSESALLSLVSSKLNEKVLFPEKVETAKSFLNNLHFKLNASDTLNNRKEIFKDITTDIRS